MKKRVNRIAAFLLSVILLALLCACGPQTDEAGQGETETTSAVSGGTAAPTTGTQPAAAGSANETETQETAVDETGTQKTNPGETQTQKANPGETTTQKTGAPEPAGKTPLPRPETKELAAQMFNNAIGKVTKIDGTYSRTMDSAHGVGFDLMSSFGVQEEFDLKDAKLPDLKLHPINPADLESVALRETETEYIVKGKLKDLTGDVSVKHGDGGYMYFIDFTEAQELVAKIGDKLSGGTFEVKFKEKTMVMNITNGELEVVFDKYTGRLKSATLSFSERMSGKATALVIFSGSCEVIGHGKGEFVFE